MSCFLCFQRKEDRSKHDDLPIAKPKGFSPPSPLRPNDANNSTKNFTFHELTMATKNFCQDCLLGEGRHGKMYKGTLQGSGQTVAIRQLDKNAKGGPTFLMEVAKINLLGHPNLVKLVGYCADEDQRLLVYKYSPMGSLQNNLFELPAEKKRLDWNTRMKIALGIAEGLKYLHEKANPPIVYGGLKSSNIMLDEDHNPQLTKHGLGGLVQTGRKKHVSPTVMANDEYSAPECKKNGEFTLKSDVYTFGIVLLELISGRKAFDSTWPEQEQHLVTWAQAIFTDQSRFSDLADPPLRKGIPKTSLNQAMGIAAMCLQDEPEARPLISDISDVLSLLALSSPEAPIPDHLSPISSPRPYSQCHHGDSDSFRECSERPCTSDSEDEDEERNQANDLWDTTSSSGYEYGESSDNSDCDSSPKISGTLGKSKDLPWSSSSKRRSKKGCRGGSILSSSSSRSRSRKSKNSGSLRCETSDSSDSEPDVVENLLTTMRPQLR